MSARVLVAGIGNVFLGDDAFGVEVAQRLARRELPEGVVVRDVGVRGLHLAYDLLEPWDRLVVIDAVSTGAAPGTLHLIQPDDAAAVVVSAPEAHGMDLAAIVATARSLGASIPEVLLVGCDVADVSEGLGLTPEVEAAVDEAARMVESIVRAPNVVASAAKAAKEECS